MVRLTICLFRRFEVFVDGQLVEWHLERRARQILAILAIQPHFTIVLEELAQQLGLVVDEETDLDPDILNARLGPSISRLCSALRTSTKLRRQDILKKDNHTLSLLQGQLLIDVDILAFEKNCLLLRQSNDFPGSRTVLDLYGPFASELLCVISPEHSSYLENLFAETAIAYLEYLQHVDPPLMRLLIARYDPILSGWPELSRRLAKLQKR